MAINHLDQLTQLSLPLCIYFLTVLLILFQNDSKGGMSRVPPGSISSLPPCCSPLDLALDNQKYDP